MNRHDKKALRQALVSSALLGLAYSIACVLTFWNY